MSISAAQVAADSERARALCVRDAAMFAHAAPESLTVKQLTGGTTNRLYLVESAAADQRVLVRFYGEGTDRLIDRAFEIKVMEACAKRGLAPRVLDVFDGGRMEEFVPSTDLFQRESEHKAGVASSLARMHLIDDVEMPPECSVFPVVWRWHRFVFGEHYESPTRTLVAPGGERIELDGRALGRDIGALQEYLRGRSPVVLAHKDLNGANVLERTSDHSLVFVDFEYAAPAARGFDIAHHFVEYSGLQCDYTRCPDRHAQDAFLRSYLQTIADHRAGGRAPPVPDHDVDALFLEVTPYWLVTHLMWGHWALYLARVQGMPDVPEHVPPTGTPMTAESFDYRVFAAMRFRQYYAMRGDEFHRLGLDV